MIVNFTSVRKLKNAILKVGYPPLIRQFCVKQQRVCDEFPKTTSLLSLEVFNLFTHMYKAVDLNAVIAGPNN